MISFKTESKKKSKKKKSSVMSHHYLHACLLSIRLNRHLHCTCKIPVFNLREQQRVIEIYLQTQSTPFVSLKKNPSDNEEDNSEIVKKLHFVHIFLAIMVQ